MTPSSIHINILILIFAVPLIYGCDTELKGEIIEFGIYQKSDDIFYKKNPATFSGRVAVPRGHSVLLEKTNRIPLIKDTDFGFCFIISNVPKENGLYELEVELEHPELTKPDQTKSTGFKFIKRMAVNNGNIGQCTGYILNRDYELVKGTWRFTYRHENKIVLQKEFITYEPQNTLPSNKSLNLTGAKNAPPS